MSHGVVVVQGDLLEIIQVWVLYEGMEDNWLLFVMNDERGDEVTGSREIPERLIKLQRYLIHPLLGACPLLCWANQSRIGTSFALCISHYTGWKSLGWLHPILGPSLGFVGRDHAGALLGKARPSLQVPHMVKGCWLGAGHPFLGAGGPGTPLSSLNMKFAHALKLGDVFILLW